MHRYAEESELAATTDLARTQETLALAGHSREHVQDSVAGLVSELLQECPGVTIIATSRRPLSIPGEQLFPIAGLDDAVAVSLFVDRALRASPGFELSDEGRSIVADCPREKAEHDAYRLHHHGLWATIEQ